MKMPLFKVRRAIPPDRLATFSPEATELLEDLSRPSDFDVIPGLRMIPPGTDSLVVELEGDGVSVDEMFVFVHDCVCSRPPRTEQDYRTYLNRLLPLPDTRLKLMALFLLRQLGKMHDFNTRTRIHAFEELAEEETGRLMLQLDVPDPFAAGVVRVDLPRVVEAWPDLSEARKQSILEIIDEEDDEQHGGTA